MITQECLKSYFKNGGLGLEPKDNFGSARGTVRGGPPNAELIVIVGEGGEILYRYSLYEMVREQRVVL